MSAVSSSFNDGIYPLALTHLNDIDGIGSGDEEGFELSKLCDKVSSHFYIIVVDFYSLFIFIADAPRSLILTSSHLILSPLHNIPLHS